MSEWLQCSGCEEKLPFPQGVHVYVGGSVPAPLEDLRQLETWVAVPARLGWCKSCAAPTYGERVPTAKELMAAAAIIRDRDNHPYLEDDLLQLRLEDIRFLFEGLGNRATAAKCLMCGGVDWFTLERRGRHSVVPGLRHTECGEPLIYGNSVSSFNGITRLRAYGFDGALIAEGTTR